MSFEKRAVSILITAFMIMGMGLTAVAQKKVLTVGSYGGSYAESQRKAFFEPYMKENNVQIKEDLYNGETGKVIAMVQSKNVIWDVIDADISEVVRLYEEGALESIDWDYIGNRDEFFKGSAREYSVGSISYSTIIAYDADQLKEEPQTIADFWNIKKWPGKRSMKRGPRFTLEHALVADGVPKEKLYELLATEAGVDRAFKKLDEIKSHIVWWSTGAQPAQLLSDGEVVMTTAWNGRIYHAKVKDDRNFKIIWENQLLTYDSWAIPKGTKNKKLAMDFIKFACRTDRAADQTNYIAYGPMRKTAMSKVDPKVQPHLPTYPENYAKAIMVDEVFWGENEAYLTERFNNWLIR